MDFGLNYAAEIVRAQVTIVNELKSKTPAWAMMAPPKFPAYLD